MNPAPDQHLLNSFYSRSENYKVWGSYVYPITQESRWESLHKSRSERIQQAITDFMASEGESLLQPLRYLEIGAGTGDTAARFQSDSEAGQVEISVVEVNPDMLEILSKRSIPTVSDFQEVPDCSYHVVAAFEVLEHMLDPVSALQIAMAKLVPGGIFVFSTPNALSLEVQILRAKSTTLDHEHITVLSLVGLAMSAKAAGFLVRKIEAAGSLDIDLITKASDMSREHGIFLPNLKWGAQKDVSLGNLSSSSFGVFQKPF